MKLSSIIRRGVIVVLVLLIGWLFFFANKSPVSSQPQVSKGVHIRMTCQTDGKETQFCKAGAERWAKKTGNTVEVIAIPHNQNDYAYLMQMMSSQSPDVDLYVIDTVWVGSFADHLVDLSTALTEEEKKKFFPTILKNNSIDGKLVAIPWYTDAGLLYYRSDLLEKYHMEVPKTWADLEKTARYIQDAERKEGQTQMWGYIFQGRAQECLTCNAYEWFTSYNVGDLIDEQGKPALDKEKAIKTLKRIKGFIDTISPKGVLAYAEEEGRAVFQMGNAIFMRGWPYVWSLANAAGSPIAGKVGVASLPQGGKAGRSVATLGGWQLSVSKYSQHKEAAIDLARYLSSREEQKIRAIEGGFNPTLAELYQDPDVLKASPIFKDLYQTITGAVARPSTVLKSHYQEWSSEFTAIVHRILEEQVSITEGVDDLDVKLQDISKKIIT